MSLFASQKQEKNPLKQNRNFSSHLELTNMEAINTLLVYALKLSNDNFKILVESLIERMPEKWKKEHLK